MAEKQTSETSTNPEMALKCKMKEITANYNNEQLQQLLIEFGLEGMPLSVHTKNILVKKIAQKMLAHSPVISSAESVTSSKVEHTSSQSTTCVTSNKKSKSSSDTELMTSNKLEPSSNKSTTDVTLSKQSKCCSDTEDLRKNLVEARESLSSILSDANKTHYAVCIAGIVNTITVLEDFREVMKIMKEHKSQNPRMLTFPSLADAEHFARNHTASEVIEGANIKSNFPQEKAEVESGEIKLFPSLTTPQINDFRIQLERGNINSARERLIVNPRYLIGNGDMPTILKEGPRYNAMHASVMAGQLESCKLIMEMMSDVDYLKRMYGTQKRAEENSKRLIDLYLNTPDKIANKVPLHFASEKGMVDIVAFLVSFKVCIRNFNKHLASIVKEGDKVYQKVTCAGQTPEEVACSRYIGSNQATVKARILNLLQGGVCYVPLIRSDTVGPHARVGDPYSPVSPYKLVFEIEKDLKAMPGDLEWSKDFGSVRVWPDPEPNMKDFRSMKVWAYAGPMSPQEAREFRKEWRSPRLQRQFLTVQENKVLDGDRGLERYGRVLADTHSTCWQEYWPFLDTFADLRSDEGLEKLECFFQKQLVLTMMRALLKEEKLISAPPFHISQDYILSPDSEDSSAECDYFLSPNSPRRSDSEEDEPSKPSAAKSENTSDTSRSECNPKPSGGMFTSLWNGFSKLRSYLSPSKGSHQKNVTKLIDNVKSKTELELLKHANNNDSDPKISGVSELKTQPDTHDPETSKCDRQDFEGRLSSDITGQPEKVIIRDHKKVPFTVHPSVLSDAEDRLEERPASSSKHKEDNNQGVTEVIKCVLIEDTGNKCQALDSSDKDHLKVNESGMAPVITSKASQDIFKTPDRWQYRTPHSSIESPESSSPGSDCQALSPSSLVLNLELKASPASPGEVTVKMKGASLQEKDASIETEASVSDLEDCQLEDSFNTKMNTLCQRLELFTTTSPNASTTTSSGMYISAATFTEDNCSSEEVPEPYIHIFMGKALSKFVSELQCRKLLSSENKWPPGNVNIPTLFLKQTEDKQSVLVDIFLPEAESTPQLLSSVGSVILDEETHKQTIKNVWINFLAVFPTTFEWKRISSLAGVEIVRASVHGVPENKDPLGSIPSCSKMNHIGLHNLFMKSRDDLEESRDSVVLDVKVVRAPTVPCKDVFVCGTVPTKVDADVYHTLNKKVFQLVHRHSSRFPLVHQWLEHLDKPGKDFINSLPTPSRVLRSERREPLQSHVPSPTAKASSSLTSKVKCEGALVRKLFAADTEGEDTE